MVVIIDFNTQVVLYLKRIIVSSSVGGGGLGGGRKGGGRCTGGGRRGGVKRDSRGGGKGRYAALTRSPLIC